MHVVWQYLSNMARALVRKKGLEIKVKLNELKTKKKACRGDTDEPEPL